MADAPGFSTLPERKSFAQVAAAAHKPSVAKRGQLSQDSPPVEVLSNPVLISPKPGPVATVKVSPNIIERRPDASPVGRFEPSKVTPPLFPASVDRDKAVDQPVTLEIMTRKDNFDTKSTASRTTLALDEKESLRPDDSASVQAAPDEDNSPINESMMAHMGQDSESGAHAFRTQFSDTASNDRDRVIMPRMQRPDGFVISQEHDHGSLRSKGVAFLQPHPVPTTAHQQFPTTDGPRLMQPTMWIVPPDEKLLDALASPKDRLFVLKVEQDFIDFIKDPSREEFLQLPGTNSFYRMLCHKLADYYMLGHIVDDNLSSVRIFRTPHCRLPPPLIGSNPSLNASTPPPTAQARKIMQRDGRRAPRAFVADDNSFGSAGSSKATSDMGSGCEDPKNNDKGALTREERESRYNEARARIFKDFEAKDAETTSTEAADVQASRSSSASGVKRTKRRGKQGDDGFEARSAFDSYGRRLSEHAYQQMATDEAYAQFAFNSTVQYCSNYGIIPAEHAYSTPGYQSMKASDSGGTNRWPLHNDQSYCFSPGHFPLNSLPYGQDAYGYSSSTNTGQLSSKIARDHTPKNIAPAPADFNQRFTPGSTAPSWAHADYAPLMYPPHQAYGNDSAGLYGNACIPMAMPRTYVNMTNQYQPESLHAFPHSGFDSQQNFNPRSQTFVPGLYGSVPSSQFTTSSHGAFGVNYAGQPQQLLRTNIDQGSTQSNVMQQEQQEIHKRQTSPYPVNATRHAVQVPRPSSIAKWATPASLPAKPPTTASGQMTRELNTSPALPPKPVTIR